MNDRQTVVLVVIAGAMVGATVFIGLFQLGVFFGVRWYNQKKQMSTDWRKDQAKR